MKWLSVFVARKMSKVAFFKPIRGSAFIPEAFSNWITLRADGSVCRRDICVFRSAS